MKFTSPSRLLNLLKRSTVEVWWAFDDMNKKYEVTPYTHAYPKPDYAWVNLIEKEDKIRINILHTLATCRGWCYEALIGSLERSRGINSGHYKDVNIHNEPLTVLCVRCNNDEGIKKGIEFLNELEMKTGWSKTVLYKHPTLKDIYLIIGSKRWKYNIPLISAFLLIPRVASTEPAKEEESLEDYTKRMGQGRNAYWGYGSDSNAFFRAMEEDVLLKMMKHYRFISGKSRYTHLRAQGVACMHDTGIGDLSDRAHFLLRGLRNYNTLNTTEKRVAKIKELNNGPYNANYYTLKVHKEIIEKVVLKVYEAELESRKKVTTSNR